MRVITRRPASQRPIGQLRKDQEPRLAKTCYRKWLIEIENFYLTQGQHLAASIATAFSVGQNFFLVRVSECQTKIILDCSPYIAHKQRKGNSEEWIRDRFGNIVELVQLQIFGGIKFKKRRK